MERFADRDGRRALTRAMRLASTIASPLFFLCAVTFAGEPAPTLDVQEVASRVFVHSGKTLALDAAGHDDIANIGFIVGERCVAVVDTGGSVRIGRALLATIHQRTRKPICYVINTHDHVDHVLGNVAFQADKPSFVGHANLGAALARDRVLFVEHYGNDFDAPATAAQIVSPDKTVETTLDIDLGGRRLTLRAWPKAHTDCDLTVEDEKTGTLWTGDLVFRERIPALDGSVLGWLEDLEDIEHMTPKIVVPGHGPVTRDLAGAIAPERRYLQALRDGVRAAIAHGDPIEQATREVALDEKPKWPLWDTAHAHNVSRAYQELEWE